MPNIIGYLRPYIHQDKRESQLEQLKAAGATKIFQEQAADSQGSGPQLDSLMAEIQHGDTVMVTSLDRIARNSKQLLDIVEAFSHSGVTFKSIDHNIDTSATGFEIMRTILQAVIDFEGRIIRERQSAGIARAKKAGRYKGRKPTARAKTDEVMALNSQGLTRQKIADELGIGVASVYRILKANTEAEKAHRKIVTKQNKQSAQSQGQPKHKRSRDEDEPTQLSFF